MGRPGHNRLDVTRRDLKFVTHDFVRTKCCRRALLRSERADYP